MDQANKAPAPAVVANPDPNQLLNDAWTTQIDAQTAQQFTGLTQIRQARSSQLQRELASLTRIYGATDSGVLAVKASLANEVSFASRLGLARDTTAITAPTPPANGWVIYGHVRNADQTPAPQITVFLADEGRAWLRQYAYAFTDQSGSYTLSYSPPAQKKAPKDEAAPPAEAESLNAFLEASNAACDLVYVDASPMSIPPGAVVLRDIVLSVDGPLGTPPCEPGAPSPTPPAKKNLKK